MFSAIVFLPLLGFLIVGMFGNRLGVKASEYITSGFMIVAALLSWVVFFSIRSRVGNHGNCDNFPLDHLRGSCG